MVLLSMIAIPIVAAILVLLGTCCDSRCADSIFMRGMSKALVIGALIATTAMAIYLYANFNYAYHGMQYVEGVYNWFNINIVREGERIDLSVGVDGTSVLFLLLTSLITPCTCLWVKNWNSVEGRTQLALFLLLEGLSIGTFVALNLFMFYLFFEMTLIPMFFIIGIWGGEQRRYAAIKFFLYTGAASILILVAAIYMYFKTGTADIELLRGYAEDLPLCTRHILWWALFLGFAVKIPIPPLHSWLPDAHVQAPTHGSVFLAGVLIKMGAYGFLRVLLPTFPDVSAHYSTMVYILSVIAIIYTSLVALAQDDMKKVIAYSSIAHMGYVTIGLFSSTVEGFGGAVMQMISHGFISAALFFCVGFIYEQSGSKLIKHFSGLASKLPVYAALFMIFTLGSIGLPGTSGFIGEYLVIQGVSHGPNHTALHSISFSILTASGIMLGALYMLSLYARVMRGPSVENSFICLLRDCDVRTLCILSFMAFFVLALGLYPDSVLRMVRCMSNGQTALPNLLCMASKPTTVGVL